MDIHEHTIFFGYKGWYLHTQQYVSVALITNYLVMNVHIAT